MTTTAKPKKVVRKAIPKKEAKKDGAAMAALEAPIFTAKGANAGTIALPSEVFGLPWNADMVHQVVTSMQANARTPIAHTKDRSEVRGGGRKPWKQKGTGRARHGSSRSPIWVGGGVTHGPRNEKSYQKKINRSMRRKTLFVTLSRKFRDGEVIFLDTLGLSAPKAAIAKTVLAGLSKVKGFESLSTKRNNAALIATPALDVNARKSFGNFGNVEVVDVSNLNPVALLTSKYLVIVSPKESIDSLLKRAA
jgi:large subunit ribosomal protein L4